ncbi:MAG: purine-cytosine permease family protein [Kineosporiaceae bacterium]
MATETGATPTITAEVREGEYGDRVVAVEPGGAEFIALDERHGRPISLFWTWMSPNLEFATVFVGVLAVAAFGQTFWQATLAIVLGTALGSIAHGLLGTRGPLLGVPQMIQSRIPFGFWGNILPAGLNAVTAGVGWFAVNSVSGTLALNALTKLPKGVCLVIVVVAQIIIAYLGHNFVHAFERVAFPLLAVAFALGLIYVVGKAHPSAATGGQGVGGFLLTLGATFGYAAGWNPYASDYTRYFKPDVDKRAIALWAGLGVFVSCVVLEIAGALAFTAVPGDAWFSNGTSQFTSLMPTIVADLVLLAIAIGAVSANAINIYSGTMSFLALGFRLSLTLRRAIVAVVFGAIGFVLAWSSLDDQSRYENFLLIIAYWIGPWLGVVFTDWYLRRNHRVDGFLFDGRHNPWAGWISMLVAGVVSILLFSNQQKFVGLLARNHPSLGDLAFEVGFVLAAALYATLFSVQRDRTDEILVVPS